MSSRAVVDSGSIITVTISHSVAAVDKDTTCDPPVLFIAIALIIDQKLVTHR